MDFVEKLGLKPLPSTPGAWKQRSARYSKSRMAKLAAEMGTIFGSMILKENAVLGQTREPLEPPTSWDAVLSAQFEVSGEGWHSGIGNLLGNSPKQMVIQILATPTPRMLMVGLITYGIGASMLYHMNDRHKHQDAVIATGIVIGVCLGIFMDMDGQAILLRILPWAVLIALWLSDMGHQYFGTYNAQLATVSTAIW
ncbi:hypothetical protein CTAM01_07284 [Colletotrichum tamarilloi]|uniref:Uncharacterized protein n=1 Tax=Colletotrichum tamarilloi TaxID=1209934 RepID=A0ABQ9R9C3_9PEZI|nr:uncharacterized protein CTAM01_07284 [Colletotrichum tamarilloi]KAK1498555.1 hypothetical protein CTAM01_07284 [Colletotrichum tamarilloi]